VQNRSNADESGERITLAAVYPTKEIVREHEDVQPAHDAEGTVNVCHEGGSIVVFSPSASSENEPRSESGKPADAEWLDHCRARELAERAAAKRAASTEARRVHQELAQAYSQMRRSPRGSSCR
jgi:hypothetical protein